ncbi:MAG TPA: trehalase family glycosidase [Roseiflexaceae bacterium]|nr:trehalase family glycosidase [Roseiflexaceae bacterium]HMP38829.1 trehalase family glycosidase [Roseiflexaceae bacterium]
MPFSDRGSRLLVYAHHGNTSSLYLKLAERLTAVVPGLSTYRNRPPFIQNLRLVDADGQPLAFEVTTYPHALVFQTVVGEFVLTFQDERTLSFGVPAISPCGISFSVLPDLARPDGNGGEFKSVRNCSYSTNGDTILNRVEDSGSGYNVALVVSGDADTAITLHIQAGLDLNRTVKPFRATLQAAEERWHTWFQTVPSVVEPYRNQYYYAWWVLGNNILSPQGFFQRESVAPSKAHYVGAWQWDNYFHSLAFRYNNPTLAADQIRFMLDHQQPDGMIPDAVYDEGTITNLEIPVAAAVTKPPIIAWSAMHVYEQTNDESLLREIYEPVVRWNSWWFGLNDDDSDGIVQYSHPFSSGLDDSPLWDSGVPVEAVDLNTYLCIQMEALARMARIIGRERETEMWRRKARALATRMIDHFYDPKAGLFWSQKDHEPIRVVTPFSLYPLWTGQMPHTINERLVAHLCDPQRFWATHPLPTVALDDPTYNPSQMWRGPVWININHIFVEALKRCGYDTIARDLAERTLQLVMGQNDIYEYYHPITGEAPPKAAPIFGWSASCFIDLAIRMSRNEI